MGVRSMARMAASMNSCGVRILVAGADHASSESMSDEAEMLQVTVGVVERLGEPCNKALGRIVGDEMAGKLGSYVARRCRVTRGSADPALALFDTAGRIRLAQAVLARPARERWERTRRCLAHRAGPRVRQTSSP